MRLIIIGPQGAGKGTQSDRLSRWFGVPHVATGELLRAAVRDATQLGQEVNGYIEAGELVPDEVVLSLLEERLSAPDAGGGFILDGFPRNAKQCAALEEMLEGIDSRIDAVVSLEVPDEVLVTRLADRWTCLRCGRVYNTTDHQPVEPGRCNADGSELVQRADDKPDAIRRRLEIFHSDTAPVIAYYDEQSLAIHVDGVGRIETVQSRIVSALAERGLRRR